MAKPLPVAAVVLPSESSASVRLANRRRLSPAISSNAAGVVGNGTVSVGGKSDAESREHSDRRYAYAVKTESKAVCAARYKIAYENRQGNYNNGYRR